MSKRIESIDILRGITIALMILVNNPGSWKAVFPALAHASWNGFTLADFVFPSFLFVMGVSMYFSFRKGGFSLSWKVLKRTLLLIGIGLALNYIGGIVWSRDFSLSSLRYMGVLQRFGLCYGIAAVLVCTLNHKRLPWIVLVLLSGYSALLLFCHGYEPGGENLLSRVDQAILGVPHMYLENGLDPEGILSTIPAVAHTLIGFLVGGFIARKEIGPAAIYGGVLLVSGLVLAFWMPLNKQIWSPSFVLFACGLGTLLLVGLYWILDRKRIWKHDGFFKVFGTNAIYCYIASHLVAWIADGSGFHRWYAGFSAASPWLSLLYAFGIVLVVWLLTLPLYRKKIFLKL